MAEKINEVKELMKNKMMISSWTYYMDEQIKRINEQLVEHPSSIKTEWIVEDFIEEKNKIELLWDELKLFLEDEVDFQIIGINNDSIKIKSLNPMAFRKDYVYCRILSNIIPTNCNIELNSHYFQADTPLNDSMVFNFSIITESNLYYKGRITIVK